MGTSSVQIAGPQEKRWALIISAPQPAGLYAAQEDQLVSAADTSTTGVKQSYTIPAGVTGQLQSASVFVNAGTPPTINLQVKRGATTFNIAKFSASGTQSFQMNLAPGDIVQWNVTVAGAGSNSDLALAIVQDPQAGRVTISFVDPAVLDLGMTLYPGNNPVVLLYEHFGSSVREGIAAVGATGSSNISVVDVFG